MYSVQTICTVIEGAFISHYSDDEIEHLVFDSRRVQQPATSLFLALKTTHNDGHKFIPDAYNKGIRNFVVSEDVDVNKIGNATIILVKDTLTALHSLAAFHRSKFHFPVIGITGSNGKTVVKEWLHLLLQDDFKIVRSPKSYNSQIGVPLSVWQINNQHTLGIFEAGISTTGEMEKLGNIIQPTIGILTNVGEAHNEGFLDKAQKLAEKLLLFKNTPVLIARNKDLGWKKGLIEKNTKLFTWGSAANNEFIVSTLEKNTEQTTVVLHYKQAAYKLVIPFIDDASVENALTCCCVLLLLAYTEAVINARLTKLHTIDMRLQLRHSINNCLVINDSYSADINSLKIALDFLQQQGSGLSKTVIISDFFESGKADNELYNEISELLNAYEVKKVIVIGEKISNEIPDKLPASVSFQTYLSTGDFIKEFKSSQFFNEIILIKGARKYEFERIARLFERKLHQTRLEINLNALANNLKEYQKLLKPNTKVMAMVKAFSYGSGGAEIASVLQYHNVHYLGVAYADEGVELVKAGITLPIMVINAEASSFAAIVDYNLQPVIYSFDLLKKFEFYLLQQGLQSYPVHIEIETGMHRLGFTFAEVEELSKYISSTATLTVQSVFSHLAASEDPAQQAFTLHQADTFNAAVKIIEKYISYPFLKHISNSAAIVKHPQLQMDMVRLGIGLYGIEVGGDGLDLDAVATLRSTVAQLKEVKKGESVSYNRKGVLTKDSLIATIRIGYADGYSRQFSNGIGKMLINGKLVPVIGTVCMDMTMVDVTELKTVKEGDDVLIFGPQLPVQKVAGWINTIPYEIMTGVSQRVRRIYFHE